MRAIVVDRLQLVQLVIAQAFRARVRRAKKESAQDQHSEQQPKPLARQDGFSVAEQLWLEASRDDLCFWKCFNHCGETMKCWFRDSTFAPVAQSEGSQRSEERR